MPPRTARQQAQWQIQSDVSARSGSQVRCQSIESLWSRCNRKSEYVVMGFMPCSTGLVSIKVLQRWGAKSHKSSARVVVWAWTNNLHQYSSQNSTCPGESTHPRPAWQLWGQVRNQARITANGASIFIICYTIASDPPSAC